MARYVFRDIYEEMFWDKYGIDTFGFVSRLIQQGHTRDIAYAFLNRLSDLLWYECKLDYEASLWQRLDDSDPNPFEESCEAASPPQLVSACSPCAAAKPPLT
ncbi:MAG: hypothetical protein NC489_24950 [Ruminococcus flavefaciens]|nr:hypothetical protein [Ruminococcus flavefaciens]